MGACLHLGEEVNLTVRVRDGDVDVGVQGSEAVALGRPKAFPEVLAFSLEEANCFGGSDGGARGWWEASTATLSGVQTHGWPLGTPQ